MLIFREGMAPGSRETRRVCELWEKVWEMQVDLKSEVQVQIRLLNRLNTGRFAGITE